MLHPKVKVQVVAGLQICCMYVQVTSSLLSVNVPKPSSTGYTLAQKQAALGAFSNTALKNHTESAWMEIMCFSHSPSRIINYLLKFKSKSGILKDCLGMTQISNTKCHANNILGCH